MKILVIGDSILDGYVNGDVERISQEAPIPILNYKSSENKLGGAANVAANLSANEIDVTLATILGDDDESKEMLSLLEKEKIKTKIVKSKNKPTINKVRYVSNSHQILRIDKEEIFDYDDSLELFNKIKEIFKNFDFIILSDYDKGSLKSFNSRKILEINPKAKIFVDPKIANKKLTEGAYLVKPNLKEFENMIDQSLINQEIEKKLKYFLDTYSCEYILLTMGAKGMLLANISKKNILNVYNFDALASSVFDITGAGDTVIATLVSEIIKGKDILEACNSSNEEASLAVQNFGTYIPKKKKKKIVFTNGCFDILHTGHINLIKYSKTLGDKLIIGLNSDRSVSKLKGNNRPIIDQNSRKIILEALECVDQVVIFDEDNPLNLIKEICPDILVKGGDYELEDIIGADFVTSRGGVVKIFNYERGKSTSSMIKKIITNKE